jgi:hypothetical protein
MRRVAVIVGANAPAPGRQALRYAHTDAQLMADVLERVGRFAKPDIQVLLEPHPGDVLAALDRTVRDVQSAGGDSLLVFYYSGHSDGQELFPHGEPLALSDLRDRVARSTARVRVAILDTCRGGSWTRTKGLTVGPALDAVDLMNVATEGTALLSSSSGLENAHEAAALNGSFFTHHVAAGLLGAADKSGDGSVTLQEVFEYAKERTVRDSARMAVTTQHPSFDMQLRGRQDIVLAQIASSSSTLEVAQTNALEVIHLGSGVTVAETPPGRQQIRLALVPGRYLVRRIADGRVYSKDIDVRPSATVSLDEGQLVATGNEKLAMKDAVATQPPFSAHSTMPKNWWEIRFGLGTSTGSSPVAAQLYDPNSSDRLERSFTGVWSFTYGITDRLSWSVPLPAFSYRFGNEGTFEGIARGGLASFAFAYASRYAILGTLDAGFATRTWLTRDLSLVSDASIDHELHLGTERSEAGAQPRDYLSLRASGGIAWNAGERLTLALGGGLTGDVALQGSSVALPASTSPASIRQPGSTAFVVGSVQSLGYRPLPLVQIHLSRRFSLDGYASLGFDLRGGPLRDRYLAGFTVAF